MRAMAWKEGRIISVHAKKGVYFLAQMLKEPYLAVFDIFKKSQDWNQIKLSPENVLFVKAVTRQFIKESSVISTKLPMVEGLEIPSRWIASHHGSRFVVAYSGTKEEIRFISSEDRPGGKLVEKSFVHPYTVTVIIPEIEVNDESVIDAYELTTIDTFPLLNERVYLCHLLGKNVDPAKDIKFDRPIHFEYLDFVRIYAAKMEDVSIWRSPE